MSNYSSGFDSVDPKLADREISDQTKNETIMALISRNEGSKVHLEPFLVNERPWTESFLKLILKATRQAQL